MKAAPSPAVPKAPRAPRTLPGRGLLWFVLGGLPLYLLGRNGALAGLGYDFLLACAALYEARSLRAVQLHAERRIDARLLVSLPAEIVLRLHNPSGAALRITVRDDFPQGFSSDAEELHALVPAYGKSELRYRARSTRRGRFEFGAIHLRVEGVFAAVVQEHAATASVRVYPSLHGPKRYELALRLHALRSLGVRALRRPGGGGEFEQLREYVPGDSYRELDWKATAKRKRPVTRVHGEEHSQTILLAIDAGRMMATRIDGPAADDAPEGGTEALGADGVPAAPFATRAALTKLDHAIHAALLLAYVALQGGDQVGLVVFAEDVLQFVPPRRGRGQYLRLLDALSEVEASPGYVDFRRLAEHVRARVPKRSLLVIFSDLLDESQALPLSEQAPLLRRKHLPLCVSMADPVVTRVAVESAANDEQAYLRAAAASLLEDRDAIKVHLRKAGVGLVEASAADLAVATVNRYLEIKATHAL